MADKRNDKSIPTADELAIRTLVADWMAATKNGDTNAVTNLMTEDALFTVPEQQPFGRDEFLAGFKQLADMDFDSNSEILEVEVFGDYAFSRVRIDISIQPPNGDGIKKQARTLTLYKRGDDGRWRLYRDANLPA